MKMIKEVLALIGIILVAIFTLRKPSNVKLDKDKEKKLIDKEKEIVDNINKIDVKITEIKQNGVKELTPEETVNYWKEEMKQYNK